MRMRRIDSLVQLVSVMSFDRLTYDPLCYCHAVGGDEGHSEMELPQLDVVMARRADSEVGIYISDAPFHTWYSLPHVMQHYQRRKLANQLNRAAVGATGGCSPVDDARNSPDDAIDEESSAWLGPHPELFAFDSWHGVIYTMYDPKAVDSGNDTTSDAGHWLPLFRQFLNASNHNESLVELTGSSPVVDGIELAVVEDGSESARPQYSNTTRVINSELDSAFPRESFQPIAIKPIRTANGPLVLGVNKVRVLLVARIEPINI